MFYFDYPHFSPTKVKSVETKAVFYDESLKDYLIEAAVFINKNLVDPKKWPLGEFIKSVKLLHEEASREQVNSLKAVSIDELLATLSFVSDPSDNTFFNNEQKFSEAFKGLILLSERFQSGFEIANAGSSRHLFLRGIDLKGSGRNKLAQRMDYSHSSGRATLNELLQDLFYGHLLSLSLPLGAERVCAISNIVNSKNYICFRTRSSMRVCNATVKFKFDKSIESFCSLIESFDGAKNLIKAHLITLTSGLLNGLRHGALNAENALICGKIIDSQTFIIEPKVNSFHFSMHIMCLKDTPGLNLESLVKAVDQNPNDFVLAHNDCYNYINHFEMVQSSLALNSDYESKNSIDLWLDSLMDDFEAKDTERLKSIFQILLNLTPGLKCTSLQSILELSKLAIVDCSYDEKSHNYLIGIEVSSVTEIDSELSKFKEKRLEVIPGELKSLQTLTASSIKFGLPVKKVSSDIKALIGNCAIVPHYIYLNNTSFRNRFSPKTVKTFIIQNFPQFSDQFKVIDIKTGESEYILMDDLEKISSSKIVLFICSYDSSDLELHLFVTL
jgi:hypothetical protein